MKTKHYRHLTWSDRLTIEKMLRQGYGKKEIARYIGVHFSTVYRECQRGAVELERSDLTRYTTYSPEVGTAYHAARIKNMEKPLKIGKDHALAQWLISMISEGYSPAAACSLLGKTPETTFSCTLCRHTVYKYIEMGILWPLTNKKLRYKSKRKRRYRRVRKASRAPKGDSIELRPEHINSRQEPGHWEMDCVEGCRKSRKTLLVLTERVTRKEIAFLMHDQTAASVVCALDRLERYYGSTQFSEIFKSITVDNGSEFMDCSGMEDSCIHDGKRTHLYYCHPYCPSERGSNEKQNQLIRWFFPKGTNFDLVTNSQLQKVIHWINHYPRQLLSWHSSQELFDDFLKNIT